MYHRADEIFYDPDPEIQEYLKAMEAHTSWFWGGKRNEGPCPPYPVRPAKLGPDLWNAPPLNKAELIALIHKRSGSIDALEIIKLAYEHFFFHLLVQV